LMDGTGKKKADESAEENGGDQEVTIILEGARERSKVCSSDNRMHQGISDQKKKKRETMEGIPVERRKREKKGRDVEPEAREKMMSGKSKTTGATRKDGAESFHNTQLRQKKAKTGNGGRKSNRKEPG